MSDTKRQKLIHIHSNVYSGATSTPKCPSNSQLEYGEIAINYNEIEPCIFIKVNSARTAEFVDKDYIETKLAEKEFLSNKISAFTSGVTDEQYPSAKLVYDTINDDEEIIARGINELTTGKIDKSSIASALTSDLKDTQVPNAKIVYEAINQLNTDLEEHEYVAALALVELQNGKSDSSHTHDTRYYTQAQVDKKLEELATSAHTHDDLYYRKAQVDTLLSYKAESAHSHTVADIPAVTVITSAATDSNVPTTKAVYTVIKDNEQVVASALNNLKIGKLDSGATAVQADKTTGTLTIQANGTNVDTFNGSANKTINLTCENIGAAKSAHTHVIADLPYETTLTGDNTLLPTGQAVKVYVDGAVAAGVRYKGKVETGIAPTSAAVGDLYIVQTLPIQSLSAEVGDFIICRTESATAPTWDVIQKNINGAVTSEVNLDSDYIVIGDGAQTIKKGTLKISDLALSAHNHDDVYYKKGEVDTLLTYKAESAHTHTKSEITDFAHTHLKADITDFAHTHAIADIPAVTTITSAATDSNVPTTKAVYDVIISNEKVVASALNKLDSSKLDSGATAVQADKTTGTLTIQACGTTIDTFNGATNKTINLTCENIGAAKSAHTHTVADLPMATALTSACTAQQLIDAKTINDTLDENEAVISAALDQLNENKFNKSAVVNYLSSAATSATVSTSKAIFDVINDNEEVIADALNDLYNKNKLSAVTLTAAATIGLNSEAYSTYETCTNTSLTAIVLTGGTSNPGFIHKILFINNNSSACVVTPPSGAYSVASSFSVAAGGALEITYIYNGSKLIFTGGAALTLIA